MVARSFQVLLITFLVLKPSLACLEAEIYLYLRLKIVFRQSSLQPSSYFLGHPVSQIRYHIWDKSEQQQSVGRLSFIYAGEGQADDEGIPGDCQCGWLVIQACKLAFKSNIFQERSSTGPLIGLKLAYMTNIAIYHMENRIRPIIWELSRKMVWC